MSIFPPIVWIEMMSWFVTDPGAVPLTIGFINLEDLAYDVNDLWCLWAYKEFLSFAEGAWYALLYFTVLLCFDEDVYKFCIFLCWNLRSDKTLSIPCLVTYSFVFLSRSFELFKICFDINATDDEPASGDDYKLFILNYLRIILIF